MFLTVGHIDLFHNKKQEHNEHVKTSFHLIGTIYYKDVVFNCPQKVEFS